MRRADVAEVVSPIASGMGHHGGVGTRILAVEDDERIRSAVKLALEDEGWIVDEAESGEEAIETLPSARRPMWC